MSVRIAVVFSSFAAISFAAYLPLITDPLSSLVPNRWTANGTAIPTGIGLTTAPGNWGSLIHTSNYPAGDGTSDYDVQIRLRLTASRGRYMAYLRASPNAALTSGGWQGNFYAVELSSIVFQAAGNCSARLHLYKVQSPYIWELASATVPCRPEMTIRTAARGQFLIAEVDGFFSAWAMDPGFAVGAPGVGVIDNPAGSSISQVQISPGDRLSPSSLTRSMVSSALYPNAVHLRWPAPPDDVNGTGVVRYDIYRNGTNVRGLHPAGFIDEAAELTPGSTHTYTIYAIDHHFNYSPPLSFSVTLPPASALHPVRTGVRPDGMYWGAMGEQIDMRSGNLNFTLPLIAAKGAPG